MRSSIDVTILCWFWTVDLYVDLHLGLVLWWVMGDVGCDVGFVCELNYTQAGKHLKCRGAFTYSSHVKSTQQW